MAKQASSANDSTTEEAAPLALWGGAGRYLAAGRALKGLLGQRYDQRPELLLPACFLYCRAIELVLKAFLRAKGVPTQDLIKKIGHDLKKALNKAEKLGLDEYAKLTTDQRDAIDFVNPYYRGKVFEYPQHGLVQIVDLAYFDEAVKLLLNGTKEPVDEATKRLAKS